MSKTKAHRRIPVGAIVFVLVLIYLSFHLITYLARDRVSIYTIGEAVSLTHDPTYTGLILRSEKLIGAEASGYVNYYLENGGRCGTSTIVYSIDENGDFNNALSSRTGLSGLSSENLALLTADLSQFSLGFDQNDFSGVYTLRDDLEYRLLSFLNITSAESLDELGVSERYFHTYPSGSIGIVEYYSDGFEGFEAASVTQDSFDQDKYEKTAFSGGAAVSAGTPVYKLIDSETWSVILPLSEQDAEDLRDTDRINVTFNETGVSATVLFEEFTGADGATYGLITLSKYMIRYADTRYLSVTIDKNSQEGLKIPVSAVTSQDFYAVPLEYLTKGGNSDSDGFYTETVTVEGTTARFTPVNVFFRDDTYAYISRSELVLGSIIAMPDSQERYAVSAVKPLPGVFCVNKGYAVFKVIVRIDSDEDYYIIKKNTPYGVYAHDNILLDAEGAAEGDKIY